MEETADSVYELPHDKTSKMTFAPSEDSDQPSESSKCTQWVAEDPKILFADAQADLKTLIRWGGCPG